MIYLSASLPKSGSTLLYTYTEQMLIARGQRHGQDALRRVIKAGRLNGVDTYLEHIGLREVLFALWLSFRYGHILIKTHAAPGFWVRQMIRMGMMRASYIYRDPRDVLLSGMDHARRTAGGKMARFQAYQDFEGGLKHIKQLLRRAGWWLEFGKVHFLTYSALLTQPQAELKRLAEFFGWKLTDEQLDKIISRESEMRSYGQRQFNTGKLSRYAEEMTPDQQARCVEEMGVDIARLGFEVSPQNLNAS